MKATNLKYPIKKRKLVLKVNVTNDLSTNFFRGSKYSFHKVSIFGGGGVVGGWVYGYFLESSTQYYTTYG